MCKFKYNPVLKRESKRKGYYGFQNFENAAIQNICVYVIY